MSVPFQDAADARQSLLNLHDQIQNAIVAFQDDEQSNQARPEVLGAVEHLGVVIKMMWHGILPGPPGGVGTDMWHGSQKI